MKLRVSSIIHLKNLIDKHKGSYLLNLSMTDRKMVGIFGEPDLVTEHNRPTTLKQPGKNNDWKCGYWYKFNGSSRYMGIKPR